MRGTGKLKLNKERGREGKGRETLRGRTRWLHSKLDRQRTNSRGIMVHRRLRDAGTPIFPQ